MAELKYRARNEASAKDKPRVYFTCHPEDFEKHFDKVCSDIFKFQDCVIYYTEDMNASIADEDRSLDIGRNNLIVIPVSFKLLTTPNRAMDEDLVYALREHIPVLPIMMESGIDTIYARPDRFGELQYLNACSSDLTEISYEEKLDKFLSSVLISDELAKRIRSAFDAYIFLSYRKKDRKYANELMRLIHSKPECRDIAIWFDEFLTPGESFRENIIKVLSDSKLFALLVTPSLLEEPDGKPNYVMGQEYPAAIQSGISILPAEMEITDKDALSEKYKGLPDCVNPHDEAFKSRLMNSIFKIVRTANDDDPMHNFLIGLAYMDGIDVETDRVRGLNLIIKAGDAGLPEAMATLYNMYRFGKGVEVNYDFAIVWIKLLYNYNLSTYGENHKETINVLIALAELCMQLGRYFEAEALFHKAHTICSAELGEDNIITINLLNYLATTYLYLGDYQKSQDLLEKIYPFWCELLGKNHRNTLVALGNLAVTYSFLGDYTRASELIENVYLEERKVLGEMHPVVLSSMCHFALIQSNLGNQSKALELLKRVYDDRCKILGDTHPDTLLSLGNIAAIHSELGDHQKALDIGEKVYSQLSEVLGEKHLHTITAMCNLGSYYELLRDGQQALETYEKAYNLANEALGSNHPQAIVAAQNLARILYYLNFNARAFDLLNSTYNRLRKSTSSIALSVLSDLTQAKTSPRTVYNLWKEAYEIRRSKLGVSHPDTEKALNKLIAAQEKWFALQEYYRSNKLCQHCGRPFVGIFKKRCSNCGELKDY